MPPWTSDELTRIESAEELRITSLRDDGTLRKPRTIWVVRYGDDLYVRSVNGRTSAWFQGTRTRHEGHVQAGGAEKDVSFVDIDDEDLNGHIDAAYRAKYGHQPADIVDTVTAPKARAATLRLAPR